MELQRLGDTVRFQRGQVGVLKSQEIAKIVGRWREWGMMTQSVIRGDRRWVNVHGPLLPTRRLRKVRLPTMRKDVN